MFHAVAGDNATYGTVVGVPGGPLAACGQPGDPQ